MTNSTRRWVKGGVAALISGGSGAVVSSATVTTIDPEKFNPLTQTSHFFELTATVFVVSGVLQLMHYLQQNPVPADDTQFLSKPASTDAQPTSK